MLSTKKVFVILVCVVLAAAFIVSAYTLISRVNKIEEPVNVPVEAESVPEAEPDFASECETLDLLPRTDEEIQRHLERWASVCPEMIEPLLVSVTPTEYDSILNRYDTSWDVDYILTTEGEKIPSPMKRDIATSNPRILTLVWDRETWSGIEYGMTALIGQPLRDDEITYEQIVSGPRIVINGHLIPEHGFYFKEDDEFTVLPGIYSEPAKCRYFFCQECLREAGVFISADGYDYSGIEFRDRIDGYEDGTVRYAEHNNRAFMLQASDVEMSVTFLCDRYDADTNTYYFTTEYRGPYSGMTDVFVEYIGYLPYKSWPGYKPEVTSKTSDGRICGIDGYAPWMNRRNYWERLDESRNEKRTEMGLPPLDYDKDPMKYTEEELDILDAYFY